MLGVPLDRIDPDEDFSDVDGDPSNEFALDNEESDRHYHWAHRSDDDIGKYLGGSVPYRVERHGDAVSARMRAEFKEGDKGEPIVKRDLVLVSCDKGLWQKQNRSRYVAQQKLNAQMFRRRQRDLDFRAYADMDKNEGKAAVRQRIAVDARMGA
jgi:hypothetical protein